MPHSAPRAQGSTGPSQPTCITAPFVVCCESSRARLLLTQPAECESPFTNSHKTFHEPGSGGTRTHYQITPHVQKVPNSRLPSPELPPQLSTHHELKSSPCPPHQCRPTIESKKIVSTQPNCIMSAIFKQSTHKVVSGLVAASPGFACSASCSKARLPVQPKIHILSHWLLPICCCRQCQLPKIASIEPALNSRPEPPQAATPLR